MGSQKITKEILTGKSDSHVVVWSEVQRVHKEIVEPLRSLQKSAESAGFILKIASGFRTFDRQLSIWNKKAVDQPIEAILKWTALPGASRHHWGTDIDVYDGNAVPPEYKVELTQEEAESTFGDFHLWLDQNMRDFGFYRPYTKNNGGVCPEPWHLSYAPLSKIFLAEFSFEYLQEVILNSEIIQKDQVLSDLQKIYDRFVLNVEHFHHS